MLALKLLRPHLKLETYLTHLKDSSRHCAYVFCHCSIERLRTRVPSPLPSTKIFVLIFTEDLNNQSQMRHSCHSVSNHSLFFCSTDNCGRRGKRLVNLQLALTGCSQCLEFNFSPVRSISRCV